VLAHAYARSGDGALISGYFGKGGAFDTAVASFGECYADQSERDYHSLRSASRWGAGIA
jgi:hypothetical protein